MIAILLLLIISHFIVIIEHSNCLNIIDI